MAEIGTLGDIVFKVSANKVRTFDDLKIDSKTNYAKHTNRQIQKKGKNPYAYYRR